MEWRRGSAVTIAERHHSIRPTPRDTSPRSPADPLAWLFALEQHGIKLGLANIRTLAAALDHPERAFAPILVAGTNGKGSVAAMIERGLRAAGYRTGL